jgi:flagellar hook-associated protein 3 FlgL
MQRVSSDLMNDDLQFWARRRERDMASAETKMARQSRIENLRDDPLAAARAVRLDSVGARLQRFEKNAAWADDQAKVGEDYVRQTVDMAQRLREIAVQGANGTYTKEDQKYMAQEVDQLLDEMVSTANARGPDGSYIFSGDKSRTEPFRAITGSAPGAAGSVLVGVQYLGAQGGPAAEISEGDYMPLSQSGADVFWAERQQAVSGFDARDWKAAADSTILVDGKGIDIKAGDNVYAVAAKINDSGAAVKATIDPRTFSLALETSTAHQLRLEDGGAAGAVAGAAARPRRARPPRGLGLAAGQLGSDRPGLGRLPLRRGHTAAGLAQPRRQPRDRRRRARGHRRRPRQPQPTRRRDRREEPEAPGRPGEAQ